MALTKGYRNPRHEAKHAARSEVVLTILKVGIGVADADMLDAEHTSCPEAAGRGSLIVLDGMAVFKHRECATFHSSPCDVAGDLGAWIHTDTIQILLPVSI